MFESIFDDMFDDVFEDECGVESKTDSYEEHDYDNLFELECNDLYALDNEDCIDWSPVKNFMIAGSLAEELADSAQYEHDLYGRYER